MTHLLKTVLNKALYIDYECRVSFALCCAASADSGTTASSATTLERASPSMVTASSRVAE